MISGRNPSFGEVYAEQDKRRIEAALQSAPVYKVADPILSNAELSEIVGELTAKCESLRSDLVALEMEYVKQDSAKPAPTHSRLMRAALWASQKIVSRLANFVISAQVKQ